MKTSTLILAFLNLVGMLLILASIADIVHLAHQEERDSYDAVDSITFLATALPVLFICAALNLGWAIKAGTDLFRRRGYHHATALGITLTAWLATYLIGRFVL